MSKIAIVYWSGTGNTEAMADMLRASLAALGADVAVFTAAEFSADMVEGYDALAFGCPSMGAEQLEDTEFEPMWNACEAALAGKRTALFGSYGWGGGEWMREWEAECENSGIALVCGGIICNDAPDDDTAAELEKMAALLV